MKWLRDHETEDLTCQLVEHTPTTTTTAPKPDSESSDIDDISSLEASMPAWLRDSHAKLEQNKEKEEKEKRQDVLQKQRTRLKRVREEELQSGRPQKRMRSMVRSEIKL